MKVSTIIITFLFLLTILTMPMSAFALANNHQNAPKCLSTFQEADRKSYWSKSGSYNQFKTYHLIINIKIGLQLNDERCSSLTFDKIKRVGFMGTINNESVTMIGEYGPNLYIWGFSFDLSSGLNPEAFKTATGAFFIETNDGEYYWIKQRNKQNYVFDKTTVTDVLFLDLL